LLVYHLLILKFNSYQILIGIDFIHLRALAPGLVTTGTLFAPAALVPVAAVGLVVVSLVLRALNAPPVDGTFIPLEPVVGYLNPGLVYL
jgi:hypothetical protein